MSIFNLVDRFRGQIKAQENQASNDLISAYQLLVQRLEDKLEILNHQVQTNTFSIARNLSLFTQLEDELTRFRDFGIIRLTQLSPQTIELANQHSRSLTHEQLRFNQTLSQAFNQTWSQLPVDEIQTLLGFIQQDSELMRQLSQLPDNGATIFRQSLIEGFGLGYSPTKITQLINQQLGQPLTWMLQTVRTVQHSTYREASRANYIENNEIIGGWKWYASLDGRCCLSCINQHGTDHSLSERLNDHHSGRCVMIPLIDRPERFGLKPLQTQSGQEWFRGLSQAEQKQRMGQAKHAAWLAGEFDFRDLTQTYQNNIYGEMKHEPSLVQLIGERADRYK